MIQMPSLLQLGNIVTPHYHTFRFNQCLIVNIGVFFWRVLNPFPSFPHKTFLVIILELKAFLLLPRLFSHPRQLFIPSHRPIHHRTLSIPELSKRYPRVSRRFGPAPFSLPAGPRPPVVDWNIVLHISPYHTPQ